EHGGLGGAPKFPQPMIWEFALRFARRSDNPYARRMVHTTLVKMARGSMYDQLGGGFARYSVDRLWLVPHFEKMLYDNAQLASLYLHAWQAFGDPECRRVCEETLDYVLREMTAPEGGFYSAQDADSEGHEGKFFVWTPDEIRPVLGADAGAGVRRGRSRARPRRLRDRRAPQCGVRARQHARERAPAPHVEGRRGATQGLSGGSRDGGRRAARSLREQLRSPLARRGAGRRG